MKTHQVVDSYSAVAIQTNIWHPDTHKSLDQLCSALSDLTASLSACLEHIAGQPARYMEDGLDSLSF